jgi:hypothetical protein
MAPFDAVELGMTYFALEIETSNETDLVQLRTLSPEISR